MTSMLLYTYPLAFNPQKAKLALEEKGLTYKEQTIDLFNGASLNPGYLRVNPSGTVPTLKVSTADGERPGSGVVMCWDVRTRTCPARKYLDGGVHDAVLCEPTYRPHTTPLSSVPPKRLLCPWHVFLSPLVELLSSPSPGQSRLITESSQILEYVDSVGEPLGGSSVDRSLVSQWVKELDAWDGNLYAAANGPSSVAGILNQLTQYKLSIAKKWAAEVGDLREVYEKKIAAMQKQGGRSTRSTCCWARGMGVEEPLEGVQQACCTMGR